MAAREAALMDFERGRESFFILRDRNGHGRPSLAAITPAWNTLYFFSGMALLSAYLFLLGGLGCLALVVFPRVKGPERSLVFFGGIASRKVDQFSEELEKIDDESLVKDLAFQCHRNAEIAKSKYTWVRRSAAFLYSAVIPWLISILLIFRSR